MRGPNKVIARVDLKRFLNPASRRSTRLLFFSVVREESARERERERERERTKGRDRDGEERKKNMFEHKRGRLMPTIPDKTETLITLTIETPSERGNGNGNRARLETPKVHGKANNNRWVSGRVYYLPAEEDGTARQEPGTAIDLRGR